MLSNFDILRLVVLLFDETHAWVVGENGRFRELLLPEEEGEGILA
jgi:hypothetical protein